MLLIGTPDAVHYLRGLGHRVSEGDLRSLARNGLKHYRTGSRYLFTMQALGDWFGEKDADCGDTAKQNPGEDEDEDVVDEESDDADDVESEDDDDDEDDSAGEADDDDDDEDQDDDEADEDDSDQDDDE